MLKVEIFRKLDGIVGEDCIIATNTSSLSVTRLAAAVSRPGHFVGMHFFNPVPAMKLVEVVTGMRTTDSTVIAVRDFAEFLGKLPIDVKDYPGFVVNRVLFPMINEAAFALQEGVAYRQGHRRLHEGRLQPPDGAAGRGGPRRPRRRPRDSRRVSTSSTAIRATRRAWRSPSASRPAGSARRRGAVSTTTGSRVEPDAADVLRARWGGACGRGRSRGCGRARCPGGRLRAGDGTC